MKKAPVGTNYNDIPSPLNKLKKHHGNYGISVGYNHEKKGKSLATTDVDGYTITEEDGIDLKLKEKIKNQTARDISDILQQELPNPIIVQTQSGNNHFHNWNKTTHESTSDLSKNLHFPDDYHIKELQGKPLKKSIESFTRYRHKQCILPPSKFKDKKKTNNEIRHYKLIGNINKLSEMGIVEDIWEEIIKALTKHGYKYYEEKPKHSRTSSTVSTPKSKVETVRKLDLKELKDNEIDRVASICESMLKAIDGDKHKGALYLGGYFSYHITLESTKKIGSKIVEDIGSIFDDSKHFQNTLELNYTTTTEELGGLPLLIEHIESNTSKFNIDKFSETLESICNPHFKKELLTPLNINDTSINVFLCENEYKKWLKYEGILEGIYLTLDFSETIGHFKCSNLGNEVTSFKFKYKNNYFEIVKLKNLKKFLESQNITLPDFFEDHIRNHLNNLNYEVTKPKQYNDTSNEEHEEDPTYIKFGYDYKHTYLQSQEGIFRVFEGNDERPPKYTPLGNVVINKLEIVLDALKILEPVYNITYYNKTFKKTVTKNHLSGKGLVKEFQKAKVFYESTKENIELILNTFIISGTQQGIIKTKTEAYLQGFFIVDDHIVENSPIKDLEYTYDDVYDAIHLLNEIMKTRSKQGKTNDSTVYRFGLWSPFSYCLKQKGFGKANYSLIEIGASQTNKTGSTMVAKLFYNHREDETTGSTVSVFGSKLESNSFMCVFDECSHLFKFPEALNIMKKAPYEKKTRATKDRQDNKKIDEFHAIGLPVFLLNEPREFEDFITNSRYKVINYDSSSMVSNKDKEDFNEKYLPETPDTVLNKLGVLGRIFSDKLIKIFETPEENSRLFKMEKLTIELLKEIANETSEHTGKPIQFLDEMYEETTSSTEYNYDISNEIKKLLNKAFKDANRGIGKYGWETFQISINRNDFDFIYFKPNDPNNEFVINSSRLKKYVNNHIKETIEIESLLTHLGLIEVDDDGIKSGVIIDKWENDNKYKNKTLDEYINRQIKISYPNKLYQQKVVSGFTLTFEELAHYIFNITVIPRQDPTVSPSRYH